MCIFSLHYDFPCGTIIFAVWSGWTNDFLPWTSPIQPKENRGDNLHADTKYFIVEASALPETFHKVLEVKRLMELEKEYTIHSATQKVGISRSAFYKYKDLIRPFHDMQHGGIVTIQLLMQDQPGILSQVLAVFAQSKVNILTINQNIPTEHCAVVTISAESPPTPLSMDDFLKKLLQLTGVIKCQLLAG